MSRIEEIINELEEYFDNCKYQPLSNTKIIVNKDEVEEMLEELKASTPDEIKRYQKMISNKDAILQDARDKSEQMLAETRERVQEMVSEHAIMQEAYAQSNEVVTIASNQAQEILDKATADAEALKTSAVQYTDNLLENVQSICEHAIETSKQRYDDLLGSLQEFHSIVTGNRRDLAISNGSVRQEGAFDIIASDEN